MSGSTPEPLPDWYDAFLRQLATTASMSHQTLHKETMADFPIIIM